MKLFINNCKGKKVQIDPVVSTRSKLRRMVGETFELGPSDYKYYVRDVFAEPSENMTWGWMLISFLFIIVATGLFILACIVSVVSAIMAGLYHEYDKKRVKKFNASKCSDESLQRYLDEPLQ